MIKLLSQNQILYVIRQVSFERSCRSGVLWNFGKTLIQRFSSDFQNGAIFVRFWQTLNFGLFQRFSEFVQRFSTYAIFEAIFKNETAIFKNKLAIFKTLVFTLSSDFRFAIFNICDFHQRFSKRQRFSLTETPKLIIIL